MSVMIIGDPHIGGSLSIGKVGIGSTLNSRITDQLNLLEWSLDKAIESNVSDIILTGDVFEDPKPATSLIAFFISWIKKCSINDINIHIIIGNHDLLRNGSVLYSPLDIISEMDLDTVHIHKNTNTIFIQTTAFTLMPFKDRKMLACSNNDEAIEALKDSLVYELAGIPNTYSKVIVGHLAIEGSIFVGDEIDNLSDLLLCPKQMFLGYDYVWMGHVHKPQVLSKKPYIAHIGSMDISNFGETDHQKHIVIFDCDNHKFSIDYLPTRTLKKVAITIPADLEDPTQYVIDELDKGEFDDAIVKVDIALNSASKSINKAKIDKFLTDKGAFNVSSISESKKMKVVKRESNTIDNKMDVVSAIQTYCDSYIKEDKKNNFMELALDIYNSFKDDEK